MIYTIKYNLGILSPSGCVSTVTYLHIQQTQSIITIHLEFCFKPPAGLLALFLVSANPRGKHVALNTPLCSPARWLTVCCLVLHR